MGEYLRAFISVDIEDPTVVSRLASIRDSLVATGAPLKPVEDANFHITLRFLGNTPISLIDELAAIISNARPRRVRLMLRGVGAFPSLERPRVIWVGVEEEGELQRLYEAIEKGVRRLGWKGEREEFVPHVTIARVKGRRNMDRLVKLLHQFRDVDVGVVFLEHVRIKQSILTRSGPIYRTLREVKAVG
ncbi:MAG: RNA 2',3'-cyclic phosphodiesterase [Hyperthermus sp.]|nr:MAG: RNA 2',3'-cyclic phosphodiesterase [Hyperthermus sp.]